MAYIHASPTLFNAGLPSGQLSSCFLLRLGESRQDWFRGLEDISILASAGGGIGLDVNRLAGVGAEVDDGPSPGVPSILALLDKAVSLLSQRGRRPAAMTVYMEPWHRDILSVLDLKRVHCDPSRRTDSLFYALWIPDLFMERVEQDGEWTLFDPSVVDGLAGLYGERFSDVYRRYEDMGMGTVVRARDVWTSIIRSQIETGGPFMMYKDAVNK
ncbi:hypothetical protein EST38_g13506 [Candolleomyces aberdarensis]|uniref:Ribonucleotide reductase large subunit C-terminal domain-containing protein n=1 Tax=Candolleomyces aberdarensis TaxID=2316362 RepID=A0A4V1Q1P9_9AGAR|nr:hypothetical protein EST38_g13506 [Candolleomyces aberdarensis]